MKKLNSLFKHREEQRIMSSSYFNRRDFLKAAGKTEVSLAVSGCKKEKEEIRQ